MSLINDALKRAKQAQQQLPANPGPGLQLSPLEPAPPTHEGRSLMAPLAWTAIALLGLLLFWQMSKRTEAARLAPAQTQTARNHESRIASEPVTPTGTTPVAQPPPVASNPSAATPAPGPAEPARTSQPAPIAPKETNASSAAVSEAADQGSPGTPSAVATEAPAPKPAPLKLQGIVFNPARPSAVVNGQVLFLGDHIGELRLVAVSQDSATLAGPSQTKVLTLGR